MNEYVYPLGSIVAVKDQIKIVILSYAIKDNKNNKSFEYLGCELITGYNPEKLYFFNNEDILYPIFIGYESKEIEVIVKKVAPHYNPPKFPFLPVGSIVETKDIKKIMIIGYAIYNESDEKYYEYYGYNQSNDKGVYFNKEDVIAVNFVGYQTKESLGLTLFLDEISPTIREGSDLKTKIEELLKVGGE